MPVSRRASEVTIIDSMLVRELLASGQIQATQSRLPGTMNVTFHGKKIKISGLKVVTNSTWQRIVAGARAGHDITFDSQKEIRLPLGYNISRNKMALKVDIPLNTTGPAPGYAASGAGRHV